jgi:hypothetical protein
MNDDSDAWLTYEEAAVRLGVTPRAARMRAFRGRWARTKGNDGRARVRLPDELPERTQGTRDTTVHVHDSGLVNALRESNAALNGHVLTLKADVERLEVQLAATEARAEKQAAELGADLATEKADREGDRRLRRPGRPARRPGCDKGAAMVEAAGGVKSLNCQCALSRIHNCAVQPEV